MLSPAIIPDRFHRWNERWGAPHGRELARIALLESVPSRIEDLGPFAWQPNNTTRAYEYPWAYYSATARGRGARIVEIGGGLSGLQFVLAREGAEVTNIDPGQTEHGWNFEPRAHQRLCEVFAAPVTLKRTTIGRAGVTDRSVDVLISISALEHFSDDALEEFTHEVPRILKPGGLAILTIDLFQNIAPFSTEETNKFGRNINVARLLSQSALQLLEGNPRELFGFPEFNCGDILSRQDQYLVGTYPSMAQCIVAQL